MVEESESVIVSQFPKNSREVICVGVSEYKGKTNIFIREYVPSLEGNLIATQSGVSLNIEKCTELIQGVIELENVMSSEKTVACIKKNGREEIRIGVNLYKDIPLIQIRTYIACGEGGEYIATRKGVAMNVNLLPQLVESIYKLSQAVAVLNQQ
jgi:hypothetical protein